MIWHIKIMIGIVFLFFTVVILIIVLRTFIFLIIKRKDWHSMFKKNTKMIIIYDIPYHKQKSSDHIPISVVVVVAVVVLVVVRAIRL